ncbi:MAG: WD40/YVTN/BNR-like repeat-containing protein [Candidatus Hodarchaeota archaeon]
MRSRVAIFIVGIAMLFSLAQRSGAQWTKVGSSGDGWITALAVSGTSFFAGTYEGVFLSTDNGTSWTAINSGLPKNPDVSCFAVMGTNVFAGTSYGVFLKVNNGSSWKPVNSGLPEDPDADVWCFAVSGPNLFAAICGHGVWRLSLSDLTSEKR